MNVFTVKKNVLYGPTIVSCHIQELISMLNLSKEEKMHVLD